MEEKLDKFLAYLEENGVEISGETAFKCNDGVVLFSPTLIVKGKKTINDVPPVIREQVKQILIDLDLPELAE